MQSSEILLENLGPTSSTPWLERFRWFDKAPFAFAFGCLLGVSSPGFDQWWLAWIALAPLLILLRAAQGKADAAMTGGAFGLGYYLVSLSWYLGLFPLRWHGLDDWLGIQAAVLIWLTESVHQSLLLAAFALMVYSLPLRAGYLPHFKRPYFPYLVSVPLIWLFFQWVVGTSELFVGIPVNQLAYSQAGRTEFIQMARLGGSGLVDFVLVLANAAVAEVFIEVSGLARQLEERVDPMSSKVGSWVDMLFVAAIVLAATCWGATQIDQIALLTRTDSPESYSQFSPSVPIAVLQGNVSIEEDRLKTASPSEIARRYGTISQNLGVQLMTFPEGLINQSQVGPDMLLSRLKALANNEKHEIVVGSIESFGSDLVNGARLISPTGTKENLYVKRRLVPFGEFAPLGQLGQQINERIPGTRESFLAAKQTHLLKSLFGKIGVSICVELIYPDLIQEEVRNGASILINVSNLGWFHQSSLNRQILAAAVFRAVENGRFLVLSTNTGISAVIDPAGIITSESYAGKRGVLLDTVQFLYGETPFSKIKWWLPSIQILTVVLVSVCFYGLWRLLQSIYLKSVD